MLNVAKVRAAFYKGKSDERINEMAENLAATEPLPASARAAGLIRWVERRPGTAFGVFLALHFAVWTVLPTLLYANLPLDLIEALTYGREWQLGHDKLPPLPWWLVEIMYRLFGTDAAYYGLAQLSVILAFVAVWTTALPLVGAQILVVLLARSSSDKTRLIPPT